MLLLIGCKCCPKEHKNCQGIYYSNNVCIMQISLGVLIVIAMVKKGFHIVGTLG